MVFFNQCRLHVFYLKQICISEIFDVNIILWLQRYNIRQQKWFHFRCYQSIGNIQLWWGYTCSTIQLTSGKSLSFYFYKNYKYLMKTNVTITKLKKNNFQNFVPGKTFKVVSAFPSFLSSQVYRLKCYLVSSCNSKICCYNFFFRKLFRSSTDVPKKFVIFYKKREENVY